jgi:hypothetical protein
MPELIDCKKFNGKNAGIEHISLYKIDTIKAKTRYG